MTYLLLEDNSLFSNVPLSLPQATCDVKRAAKSAIVTAIMTLQVPFRE
ncbi:MAG: hypothetical protein R2830_20395 [Saprospiraceae bacterium]